LKRVIIPMKMADSAATNTPVSHTLIDAVPVLHPTSSLSPLKTSAETGRGSGSRRNSWH
jgi:hypothetical protein